SQTGSPIVRTMLAGLLSPGGGMSTTSLEPNSTVPNTRRIGCSKLAAEYWLAAVGSGKPQSQGGARRTLRVLRRWIATTVVMIDEVMKTNTSSPLYELRLAAIGMMVCQASPICTGIRAPVSAVATGARLSITIPGMIPVTRHSDARLSMAASDHGSVSRA